MILMDKKNTYIVGAVLVLALSGFLFVLLRTYMVGGETPPPVVEVPEDRTIPALITAKHAYQNGEHILAGEINLPTPCHLLEHTVTVMPDGSRATIAFTRRFAGGDCPGGEKPARFLVKFPGNPDTVIRATVDGKDVPLSLIPALPGENLEDTEVFLKG
jgi:hypothetical protein